MERRFGPHLCVATLVASEIMPVSLLTPIATDLQITEGQAGQAIAVSGIFAVLASLCISPVTRGIDRRRVLLSLTLLMMVSGIVVALAPNPTVFMAGRALIGAVIGGFWSMSAATAMRLVPKAQVPRALAIFNGGNALATTIAAPLGSFLGQYIGGRGAFFSVVPVAALALVCNPSRYRQCPPTMLPALIRSSESFADRGSFWGWSPSNSSSWDSSLCSPMCAHFWKRSLA
jgi:predicted MFS family arabinose efflux permease